MFIKILKNTIKKHRVLIIFDDMIADMTNTKKLNPIVTELFVRGRKLNIFIVFITQSYFEVPKEVRLNTTHFFIMKSFNKRELQQIALNHPLDIDFKDVISDVCRDILGIPFSAGGLGVKAPRNSEGYNCDL